MVDRYSDSYREGRRDYEHGYGNHGDRYGDDSSFNRHCGYEEARQEEERRRERREEEDREEARTERNRQDRLAYERMMQEDMMQDDEEGVT